MCESTGNLWIKTYEAFEDRGIPIELANPMKVRAIAEASVKTDKVDARTLAHLLRTNLIARCHVAERGVRGVRQLLRERNNLVKARTQAINRLHNLLDRYDLNPKDFAQDIWREKALKALDSKSLADPNDDYVLHRYVRGIRHHNAELGLLEKKIAGHASASEDARILMSMTGMDYYAAMLLASEIDRVGRFASPKKLVSWAGMCPTVPPVGQHDVPRTDEEGFEQEGKLGIDPGGARGRALRRPDEGLLREDEKDPPQQHRYHARCEQDDQDNLAHADNTYGKHVIPNT